MLTDILNLLRVDGSLEPVLDPYIRVKRAGSETCTVSIDHVKIDDKPVSVLN
jgi:hypothetical protein